MFVQWQLPQHLHSYLSPKQPSSDSPNPSKKNLPHMRCTESTEHWAQAAGRRDLNAVVRPPRVPILFGSVFGVKKRVLREMRGASTYTSI